MMAKRALLMLGALAGNLAGAVGLEATAYLELPGAEIAAYHESTKMVRPRSPIAATYTPAVVQPACFTVLAAMRCAGLCNRWRG